MVERRKRIRKGSAETHPLAAKVRLPMKAEPPERRHAQRPPPERQRATFLLPTQLIDRLRDAVHGTEGETMAGIVTASLERTVDEMERARGSTFPRHRTPLKPGRPRK